MKKDIQKYENLPAVVNPHSLIAQAIDKNLPIESMERLLAMRKELKAESAREKYFESLSLFQEQCPVIERTKKVYSKNNQLRYKYAPLEDIVTSVRELLKCHGFSYTIKTSQEEKSVTAICESHHVAGHTEVTSFTIPIDPQAYMTAAQKVASALTFAKRYSFCNAFGIMTGDGDDDGLVMEDVNVKIVNEPEKKEQPGTSFNDLPEENKAIYSGIMALINQKEKDMSLFLQKEKVEAKKKADAVSDNMKHLEALYKTMKAMADVRREHLKKK